MIRPLQFKVKTSFFHHKQSESGRCLVFSLSGFVVCDLMRVYSESPLCSRLVMWSSQHRLSIFPFGCVCAKRLSSGLTRNICCWWFLLLPLPERLLYYYVISSGHATVDVSSASSRCGDASPSRSPAPLLWLDAVVLKVCVVFLFFFGEVVWRGLMLGGLNTLVHWEGETVHWGCTVLSEQLKASARMLFHFLSFLFSSIF